MQADRTGAVGATRFDPSKSPRIRRLIAAVPMRAQPESYTAGPAHIHPNRCKRTSISPADLREKPGVRRDVLSAKVFD